MQLDFDDEGPEDLIANTLSPEEFSMGFDERFGGHRGKAFTAWSETYVYFPVVYGGSEGVGRAPRHPGGEATEHQGEE